MLDLLLKYEAEYSATKCKILIRVKDKFTHEVKLEEGQLEKDPKEIK